MARRTRKRIDGTGSIFRRPSGRFSATITDPDTGRRLPLGTFDTEFQAEQAIAREVAAGGRGSDAGTKLGIYLERWIESHRPHVSSRMTKRYRGDARRYVLPEAIAEIALGDLEPEDFSKLYGDLLDRGRLDEGTGKPARLDSDSEPIGLAGSTVQGVERMLSAAINAALRSDRLRTRPPLPPKIKVEERERAWADTDEVARILRVVKLTDSDLEVAVRLAAIDGGLRRGEVAGLEWGDVGADSVTVNRTRAIDGESGDAVVGETKTKGSRATIALSPVTVAAFATKRTAAEAELGRRVRRDDPIYQTPEGEALYPDTISERFGRVVAAYNETHDDRPLRDRFTFHSLRHSFATNLIAAGVPTIIVAAAGRWESVALVERLYGHHAPSTVADAVGRYAEAVAAHAAGYDAL
jgi:integrase